MAYWHTMGRRGDGGINGTRRSFTEADISLNKLKIVVHLTALTGEAVLKGPALTRRLADLS
jgi:hypothetical protein